MDANIVVNPETLIATIVLNGNDEKLLNSLKLICSGLSDDFKYQNKKFYLPWFELRRGINSVAYVLKKAGVTMVFDDFTAKLLQEVVIDRKNIKERAVNLDIDEECFKEYLINAGFKRTLKAEQIRDAISLLNLRHGANFSVPGAGKTTTVLALHTVLKQLGVVNKLLVISPINAFISWEDEIEDIFGKETLNVERFHREYFDHFSLLEAKNPDVVLINYEKLRRDIKSLIPFFIKNKIHLILDESHRVKSGVNNMSYNQIIKIADLAKRRDILSGTPMPQSFEDLQPQFDYLWPGENIISPKLIKGEESQIIINVNQAIKGLFVRTTKNELGLKEPIVRYTSIPMGPIQAELYKLFKSEAARIMAGMDRPTLYNFRKVGRSVVKLLQAATNPMLLAIRDEYGESILPKPKIVDYWELLEDYKKYEKPTKIEYLIHRIKEILIDAPGSKILIWTYFVRNILILEKIFKEYNPVTIFGGIPSGSDEDEANREGRIRKFLNDPSCRIMIANPQACGEGISLHKVCHNAIYLDRNFNAAYYLQSIDRIHRLGLDPTINTTVEILVAENSIDELLIQRLNDKIKAMGSVLEDSYLHSLAYDPADISKDDDFGIDSKDFVAIKEHVTKS